MPGADKQTDHQSMDLLLADIADHGDQLHICSQAPSNFAEVVTYSLGYVALVTGDGNGAYTIQDGVVSGRRLSLADQTVPGTAAGIGTHAVIVDTVNSRIKSVTTAPNYNMQVGVNQAVPGYDVVEVKDPV
jgi:hypothetical protein